VSQRLILVAHPCATESRAVPETYRRACASYGPGNGLLFRLRTMSKERHYRVFYPRKRRPRSCRHR
jgi:hypothetical protein